MGGRRTYQISGRVRESSSSRVGGRYTYQISGRVRESSSSRVGGRHTYQISGRVPEPSRSRVGGRLAGRGSSWQDAQALKAGAEGLEDPAPAPPLLTTAARAPRQSATYCTLATLQTSNIVSCNAIANLE